MHFGAPWLLLQAKCDKRFGNVSFSRAFPPAFTHYRRSDETDLALTQVFVDHRL